MTKSELRQFFKSKVLSHKSEEVDARISQALFEFLRHYEGMTFGLYAPLADEINWVKSFHDQVSLNRICFPTVKNNSMAFCALKKAQDLQNLDFFLDEVQAGQEIVPDVLVVPALAFDKNGVRLGRGRGHYDRYLKEFKGIRIGVCYSYNFVDELPIEEHDQKVDFIITEEELLKCESNGV